MQPYMVVPPSGSDQADEWVKLGVDAHVSGNLPKAQQHYQQALRLDSRHFIATQNLALVFAQSNFINEGLLTIERAAMMDGTHAVIQRNWALMALQADRIDEALAAGERGFAMKESNETRIALAMVLASAGRPQEAVPLYERVLDENPKDAFAGPAVCFVQTLTDSTPQRLLEIRKKWYDANRYTGKIAPHKNDRSVRPLRIGYVGGDFKCHSAAMIFGNVVLHHSKDFEVFLYGTLAVDEAQDGMTKRFKAAGKFRDIGGMSDEDADKLIRSDGIDILVDLAGHTNGGRLALFTRKPAPIQCTGWGFAHGTGCPEIDYFFADPIAVPAEERQHYAEKVYDLPCIVTYEAPEDYNLSGKSMLPYHKNGYITFGSYARYEKLSDACLETFADVLRAVPDSRLQFKDHGFKRPYAIKRVLSKMQGIEPERLLFSIATTHPEHMHAYQQADLMLDPFPHTGGVVSLEELYMGVPIVTLYGTQASGRSTSSILTAMGHGDWIALSRERYVEIAARMAGDIPMLTKLRKTLRDELLGSPVVKGYVATVEAAYRDMWLKWIA